MQSAEEAAAALAQSPADAPEKTEETAAPEGTPSGNEDGAQEQPSQKAGAAAVFLRFLFVPAAIYYDLVLLTGTTRSLTAMDLLFLALFDVAWGLAFALLWSLFPRVLRRPAQILLLFLQALPYGIEYFVYLQFKIFYDVNTVRNGANDVVAGGFLIDIWRLMSSPQGILHLALFLAPTILALIVLIAKRREPVDRPRWRFRLIALLGVAAFTLLPAALLSLSPSHQLAYLEEYSFPNAVERFGLMTGVRLDVERIAMPDRFAWDMDAAAERETAVPLALSDPANRDKPLLSSVTPPSDPVVPCNVLDIDFDALPYGNEITEALNAYVSSLEPSRKNRYTGLFEGKNLIMITAEAFSGDIIDPDLTPTLYRLATKGINFTDYYMPASAGTTGGEFAHIFGMLPLNGGSSMTTMASHNNYWTMGSQLDRLGYYGKMYHNNSYTYYDRHITHFTLGYSDGYMGIGNGMEEYVNASHWPESDLEMFQGTLPTYIDKEHFNIYYMTVSGHSGYSFGTNYMSSIHRDQVADLPYSEPVAAYIACNLELEDALTYMVETLEEAGLADDTVICLTADHFPYGLDNDASLGNMPYLSELYGYPVNDVFARDHNRLIIWSGCLEDQAPIVVDTPVSATDILPTLSNLFGLEYDSRMMPGRDVFSDQIPLVWFSGYEWKTDLGTYAGGVFYPASDDVRIPDGYVDRIRKMVSNKINYCRNCLATDYFGYLFGY